MKRTSALVWYALLAVETLAALWWWITDRRR